jgi:acetylornithine/N-succinyldiaminopimelate aminotransferase
VFDRPVRGIIDRAMENGLILINAGPNILRFVPPLIVTEKEIDKMAEILSAAIEA